MSQFIQDLRFGARTLAHSPGFTALAVASLALGVMAVTAMYSVIHAVVLDPFPYKDVDSLMSVRVWGPEQRGFRTNYSTDQFLELAERNTIFDGVIASTISDVLWTGEGDPQRLRGNYGPPNTFLVMGVPAVAGRYYTPEDGRPDAAPVVVLGYRFWQRQFGGDPSIVGRQLKLNDRVRTVVGVMPKRFMWRGADVYLPIVFERGRAVENIRNVHVLGRLKPGVTEARAEADLRPVIADFVAKEPQQFPQKWRVGLLSFKETFPSSIRDDLWMLFGAVGLLLLIACANVSNLLLARAAARQREMAVRAALGGSRARLVRQLLTESLLLAIAGGAAGTLLAYGALRVILTLVPPGTIPDESDIALNLPVLAFALIVSAATSLLFGLAPAIHACTRDLTQSLRSGGRGLTGAPPGDSPQGSRRRRCRALDHADGRCEPDDSDRARDQRRPARVPPRSRADHARSALRAEIPGARSTVSLLRRRDAADRDGAGRDVGRRQHIGPSVREHRLAGRGSGIRRQRSPRRAPSDQRRLHEDPGDRAREGTYARTGRGRGPPAGRARQPRVREGQARRRRRRRPHRPDSPVSCTRRSLPETIWWRSWAW